MFNLFVNSRGKVTKLVDSDGNTRQFKVKQSEGFEGNDSNSEGAEESDEEDEEEDEDEFETDNERVINRLISDKRSKVMKRMARNYNFKQAICTIGTTQLDFRFFPSGVAYRLEGDQKPKIDAFPVDFSYGSGITVAEISLSTSDVTLSSNYFTDERISRAQHAIRQAGRSIGVVDSAEILDFMLNFTSAAADQDPFLVEWEGNDAETPAADKTFAGVFLSNWSTVHDDTQAAFDHDNQQPSHFYVVVRDSLPDEVCDQLRHVVRFKSQVGSETWRELAGAVEFERCKEIGKNARRHKLDRICEALGVVYQESRISDTCTDFITCEKGELNVEDESDSVFFYSGCSSSLEVGPGRAIMANDNCNPPEVIWLHGPSNGRLGGGQWREDENLSAFPEVINSVSEDNIGALVASGWDVTNGFVHMSHLATIHKGDAVPFDQSEP